MGRDERTAPEVSGEVYVPTVQHARVLGVMAWVLAGALVAFVSWRLAAVGRDTESFFHRPLASTVRTVRDGIERAVTRAEHTTLVVGEAMARGTADTVLLRDVLDAAGLDSVVPADHGAARMRAPDATWLVVSREGRSYRGRLANPESLFLAAAALPIESFTDIGMAVLWHDGDTVRTVAALGEAPPTRRGRAWATDALPPFVATAFGHGQWAGTTEDLDGRRVIMVTARGTRAPVAVVRTMDAARAIAPFRRRLVLDLLLALVLGGGCVFGAFAFARSVRMRALEAQLTAARLSVLQQQLRPHFLFNSLNAIAGLVHADPDRADRMIVRLADLLRLSFSDDAHRVVSLEREMELLRAYIDAEHERFDEDVALRAEVPVELLGTRLPAWTLQPLAENILKHELPPWVVQVRAERRTDGRVAIIVEGAGRVTPTSSPGTGLGLRNVRARLVAAFGVRASLTLRPRPGRGVVAEVLVPPPRAGAA